MNVIENCVLFCGLYRTRVRLRLILAYNYIFLYYSPFNKWRKKSPLRRIWYKSLLRHDLSVGVSLYFATYQCVRDILCRVLFGDICNVMSQTRLVTHDNKKRQFDTANETWADGKQVSFPVVLYQTGTLDKIANAIVAISHCFVVWCPVKC